MRGWVAVSVLLCAYAVSFVDRQIVNLLVAPLKADFALSDTQIGLLQGPAFGIFFALLGLPLGWLADRIHRVRLIAAGLALWSLATFACGLATSFRMLFGLRVLVGVGEAALVPAAVSLLADLFTADRRALPLSIFTAGLSLGAGLALLLGGAFIAFAGGNASRIGWFAHFHPWQVAFQCAGLLGLPVIACILLLPEPPRARSRGIDADSVPSILGYLLTRRRLFLPLLGATTVLYVFSNALAAWMPTIFQRLHGWSPAEVGTRLGGLVLLCAISGNLGSGLAAARLARRGRVDAPLLTMIAGVALMIPAAAIACLASTPATAMAGFALLYLGVALCFGVATTALVATTPESLRGRMVAIYLLAGNLVGLGLGPPSVGWLTDHVLHDPAAVAIGLGVVAVATLVPGLALLVTARQPFVENATAIARAD